VKHAQDLTLYKMAKRIQDSWVQFFVGNMLKLVLRLRRSGLPLILSIRTWRKHHAVKYIREFLHDNKYSSPVQRFHNAARVVQRYIRDFLVCKAARLAILDKYWQGKETALRQLMVSQKRSAQKLKAKKAMQRERAQQFATEKMKETGVQVEKTGQDETLNIQDRWRKLRSGANSKMAEINALKTVQLQEAEFQAAHAQGVEHKLKIQTKEEVVIDQAIIRSVEGICAIKISDADRTRVISTVLSQKRRRHVVEAEKWRRANALRITSEDARSLLISDITEDSPAPEGQKLKDLSKPPPWPVMLLLSATNKSLGPSWIEVIHQAVDRDVRDRRKGLDLLVQPQTLHEEPLVLKKKALELGPGHRLRLLRTSAALLGVRDSLSGGS